jgi:hypothetical protein
VTKTSNTTKGFTVSGKTRETVISFFGNVLDRKFSDAERDLEEMKTKKFTDEEYRAGYLNALEGILLSIRSGDERDFLNKVELSNENARRYKAEFKDFSLKPIRSNFDQGFFAAWQDLMKFRIKTDVN